MYVYIHVYFFSLSLTLVLPNSPFLDLPPTRCLRTSIFLRSVYKPSGRPCFTSGLL